jgi:signal transduction histidine kinase
MDEQSSKINLLVLGGTGLMILLLLFIAVFIIIYQRRNALNKMLLHRVEMQKQQALLAAIITTEEKERQYFAQELHDSVGQMLSAVKLNLSGMKRTASKPEQLQTLIDETTELASQSIKEVRLISHKLLPGVLLDFGLKEALQQLCGQLRSPGLNATCSFDDSIPSMNQSYELAIYRITQELVSNTVKYAEASEISVSIKKLDERILYSYADNGKGFDTELAPKGLGLRNIESRLSMMNARMQFSSAPGQGLQLKFEIAGS